jgi:hypothetical protein
MLEPREFRRAESGDRGSILVLRSQILSILKIDPYLERSFESYSNAKDAKPWSGMALDCCFRFQFYLSDSMSRDASY